VLRVGKDDFAKSKGKSQNQKVQNAIQVRWASPFAVICRPCRAITLHCCIGLAFREILIIEKTSGLKIRISWHFDSLFENSPGNYKFANNYTNEMIKRLLPADVDIFKNLLALFREVSDHTNDVIKLPGDEYLKSILETPYTYIVAAIDGQNVTGGLIAYNLACQRRRAKKCISTILPLIRAAAARASLPHY
jgi:hypothetical protein